MKKAQILIVEEDRIVAEHIKISLKESGYSVYAIVPSGEEALDKLKISKPDLVLMDIMLKGEMDGIETAQEIKAEFEIPVVYLTAYADDDVLDRAKTTEPFGFIIKPFEDKELDTAIEIALYKHKMEKRLKESEQRFSTTLKSIGDAVIATDLDGKISFMNPIAQLLTGWNDEEAIGKPLEKVFNIINEETRKRVEDPVTKVIREKSIIGLANHTLLIARDGEEIPIGDSGSPIIDEKGNITGVVLVFRDVREKQQARLALRKSENRLKKILDVTSDGFWDINLITGEVHRSSNAYATLGYAQNDLENNRKSWEDLLHPAEKHVVLKSIDEHIEGMTEEFRAKHRLRNKAGGWQWFLSRGKVVDWNEDGHPSRFLGTIEDISEYKKIEEEKKKLEVQLQQAHKMEAIGTLAGGIAHDFNNILSPIMIHSEMAMEDLPHDHPLQLNLKQIFQAGERARDLVKQILTFSRMRQQERTVLRIGVIVKEIVKLIRASLPSTIKVTENILTKSDTVLADPTQVHQVVMNLCTNAAHAMREKGGVLEVNLTDEHIDSDFADKFPDLNPGPYLKLTVKDTGRGMDEETIKRIFEPYFTTKDPGEGTGMGLAVVHGIVKSYGGEITVESTPGMGSTFNVLLPWIQGDTSDIRDVSSALPKGSERILFVDDEQPAVSAIQPMLERLGYTVTARTDGIEALEIFRNNPDEFDLVITDQTMPGMTGKDLSMEMKSIRPNIPIILCTGFSEQIDAKMAQFLGIKAFLMKPIVMREIAGTIREVLDDK